MQDWKNLSAIMRPAPFWSWNDKLNEAELRRQIREMADKGWGSYFMHSRVGLVTGYLSEEWMSLVNACADEAEKTGTYAWLYDEDKWPSGFAGGQVPKKDKAYRSRALVILKKGTATKDDTVFSSIIFAGVEYEICKRVSPLGSTWFNGASYVDLMNSQAVREFIATTHQRYKKACGRHFGKTIPGIFTDEPCYLMQNEYDVLAVPWSDFLPKFFRELKGYDLMEKLPLLFFEMKGYRKVRYDFYDTASELFKRSFTRQYYEWCQANNLIMTGHFQSEDTLCAQTEWSGDVMSHYEFMHWPGVDKLCRAIDQIVTVKQVSSAADQLGKERVLCEVFGCTGGQVSFLHRKWIGDWGAALGINFVNHHLSLYSMRGERKRDYPPNFFYQQPWWGEEKGFADYQARLCTVVSEGKRMIDILLLQPLSSVWCEYSPRHRDNDFVVEKVYDLPFAKISRLLMEEKLDFHYGNENLIAKYGSVDDAVLNVGRHSYNCVIVPPASNLKSSTLLLFQEYVKSGGRLIFSGTTPFLVEGMETKIELEGSWLASSTKEAVNMVSRLFPNRIRVIDNLTGGNASSVYLHSRKVGDSTRHLLVNTDDKREIRVTVKMPAYRRQEKAVLDLYDGSLYRLDAKRESFNLTLAPAGSILVICGKEASQVKTKPPPFLGSGASFSTLSKELPSLLIENFNCEIMEENVLLLDEFVLELNGKKVYEGSACGAWHKYFYPAKDGTFFVVTYTFHSETKLKGCFAAIEVAENLDSITLNRTALKAMKAPGETGALNTEKNWKDINFTKVPLPLIKKGINTLVIRGRKVNNISGPGFHFRVAQWKKHRPTEVEEAYICGKFLLKRCSASRYVISSFKTPSGKNLTHEGFPFYCGKVGLKAGFNLKKKPKEKVFLRLNGTAMACAAIMVNDKRCGTLRWEPFTLDISDAVRLGDNTLVIEMATTMVNAFGPNRRTGVKEENFVGPGSFIEMERFKEGYELFDFGLESAAVYITGAE